MGKTWKYCHVCIVPGHQSLVGQHPPSRPVSAKNAQRLIKQVAQTHARAHSAGTAPSITLFIPGTPPANHPPTEACRFHSKPHRGCRMQDPGTRGYRRWKTADFSHSPGTAHDGPPKRLPPALKYGAQTALNELTILQFLSQKLQSSSQTHGKWPACRRSSRTSLSPSHTEASRTSRTPANPSRRSVALHRPPPTPPTPAPVGVTGAGTSPVATPRPKTAAPAPRPQPHGPVAMTPSAVLHPGTLWGSLPRGGLEAKGMRRARDVFAPRFQGKRRQNCQTVGPIICVQRMPIGCEVWVDGCARRASLARDRASRHLRRPRDRNPQSADAVLSVLLCDCFL